MLFPSQVGVLVAPQQPFGWVHILPALAGLRLLCICPYDVVVKDLAAGCSHLTRLHDLEHLPSALTSSVPAGSLIDERVLADFPGTNTRVAMFDGIVVHDPEGLILHTESLPRIRRWLRRVSAWLSDDAFVYLGVANSNAPLKGLIFSTFESRRPVPVRILQRILRDLGLGTVRKHAYLTYGSWVTQILPVTGYRSTKNRELIRERVKEWMLGSLGSQFIAPAYGLVGFRDPCSSSVLDEVVERVGLLRGWGQPVAAVLKEYLILGGHKAILSIGPTADDQSDVVVVIVADSVAEERRRKEVDQLKKLATLSPPLSACIPVALAQFSIDRASCFVLNRMLGVTLDRPVDSLENVTSQAVSFLISLHKETAKRIHSSEDVFHEQVTELLNAACFRNPRVADSLRACAVPLRASLLSATLPLVWMHGDFKVENVMYAPVDGKLTAVIDWEHAIIPGFPVLDLLYLLIFNRIICGIDWLAAFDQVLVRWDMTPVERAHVERYCAQLDVPQSALPGLSLLFVMHHIGHRMHLPDVPTPWVLLNELIKNLRINLDHGNSRDALEASP